MTDTLWITGGRLVTPGQGVENGSVLIQNGKIAQVNGARPADAQVVDAQGGYILPGFIDLHLHGGGGADFMDGDAQAIRTAAKAHCIHGTTALVPTSMTCEDALLEQFIRLFLQVKQEGTGSADLLGLHLEGPFFSAASKGAQPITQQRVPTRPYLEHILALAKGEILRWDAAPELDNMELFAQVMRENHVLASVAHTSATAERAEQAFSWGFSHVTHFYNATTTFHKVNHVVHSGVIEATYLDDQVTIELIGDGKHIPKQSMLLALRIKGPDKIALITDAMRAAGTNVKTSILGPKSAGVPVVIENGVAQLPDLSSYAGSIATMDAVARVAHLAYGIPLEVVSEMLSMTPARLCNVADHKGSLEEGKDADVVLMTPSLEINKVFVRGNLRHDAQKSS